MNYQNLFKDVDGSSVNTLSGMYEDFLENLRAGAERFRAEYSETMREYVTEQKNVLEEIIETVDKAGSSEEHQSALERFLFGANNKEKFQQNLNEYTEHMENIKAINERYADDEDKRKSALFLLNQNRKQSSDFKGDDDEENPNGFVGENLNCFLKKIVVEIKRKICEWQCPEKYAIFAM